jgi:hypothetical protein
MALQYSMRARIFKMLAGLALFAGVIAENASAHHGWAANEEPQFELTGKVVKPVSLSGPHANFQIRAQGQVWDITLAPPTRTERAGLLETSIPVGAEVTVSGHRSSDPKRFEIKTERVTYQGKVFNVYPDRE